MCVVSMVMDHYQPLIPSPPYTPVSPPSPFIPSLPPPWPFYTPSPAPIDLSGLEKLIREFKEAVEAAKKVDQLTGQPDCVDAEKVKLEDRVAALEAEIARMRAEGLAT